MKKHSQPEHSVTADNQYVSSWIECGIHTTVQWILYHHEQASVFVIVHRPTLPNENTHSCIFSDHPVISEGSLTGAVRFPLRLKGYNLEIFSWFTPGSLLLPHSQLHQ